MSPKEQAYANNLVYNGDKDDPKKRYIPGQTIELLAKDASKIDSLIDMTVSEQFKQMGWDINIVDAYIHTATDERNPLKFIG